MGVVDGFFLLKWSHDDLFKDITEISGFRTNYKKKKMFMTGRKFTSIVYN